MENASPQKEDQIVKNINELIHKDLVPIVQMFHSYEQLSANSTFRFRPEIFRKAALKGQSLIELARKLVEVQDGGEAVS